MLSSSWGEDTPRSKSIPSAPDRDSSFKILSIWSKLLWTRVTRSRHWAIRIAVNDELASVDRMLQAAVPRLNPGGRLAVITFHSLEDRIVKTGLAEFARGCTCPPDFPVCVCGKKPQIRLVSRKPILPSEEEVRDNPRARSAKLRAAEKL